MKKAIALSLSILISFYAGQSFAGISKPCPKNKALHANTKKTTVTAKQRVLAALNTSKVKSLIKSSDVKSARQVQ